jgi:hypothetical protein
MDFKSFMKVFNWDVRLFIDSVLWFGGHWLFLLELVLFFSTWEYDDSIFTFGPVLYLCLTRRVHLHSICWLNLIY